MSEERNLRATQSPLDSNELLDRRALPERGAITKLTLPQAEEIEAELRALEGDPEVGKQELRLFLQSPMPCGHAVGNLLTCPDPPFGCVICGEAV